MDNRRTFIKIAALIAIFLIGLLLRFSGLSHDLLEGERYHPDTPKQIRATGAFLRGEYYSKLGNRDYDGYPYFNSHLVEYIYRATSLIKSFVYSHLGIQVRKTLPSKTSLYLMTRILNALLSTLIIIIIYKIAKENFDDNVALLAAFFVAISPLDITTCHFATCDSTASFFAILSLLFAMRIYTHGRFRDYLFASVFSMFAFAAKYHGGMALLPSVVAHICRYNGLKKIFSRGSLLRLGAFFAMGALAFFIAIPSMFIYPKRVIGEIIGFCKHTASYGVPKQLREAGIFSKSILSFRRNLPVLFDILGPLFSAVVAIGLLQTFSRNKKLIIIGSLPLFYILVGFSLKPFLRPDYHTLISPILFLIGAMAMIKLARIKKARILSSIAFIFLLFSTTVYLLNYSLREGFYYLHRDTRKIAKEWTRENIPIFFDINEGPYTFLLDREKKTDIGQKGTVYLVSHIRPIKVPEGFFLLRKFSLEERSLPRYRNPAIEIFLGDTKLIRGDFSMPIYQRLPSRSGNDFIFVKGANFYHNEKIFMLKEGRELRKIFVSDKPLDDVIIILRNDCFASKVNLSFGGGKKTISLKANETKWVELRNIRRRFPYTKNRYFYKLAASVNHSRAWMMVANNALEKGTALYNIGDYTNAYRWLIEAIEENDNPTLSAMATISGRLAKTDTKDKKLARFLKSTEILEQEIHEEELASIYGISIDYLNALGYINFEAEELGSRGFKVVADSLASGGKALITEPVKEDGKIYIGTPPLMLEQGCYIARVRIRYHRKPDRGSWIKIALIDTQGRMTMFERRYDGKFLSSNYYTQLEFPFEKPGDQIECSIAVEASPNFPISVDRIDISADPLAGINALRRLLNITKEGDITSYKLGLLDYRPLLILGDQFAKQNDFQKAYEYYLAATKIRPKLAKPIEKMGNILNNLSAEQKDNFSQIVSKFKETELVRTLNRCNTVFDGGIRLEGYRLKNSIAKTGDTISLNFYWEVKKLSRAVRRMFVWVHFLDENGQLAFQGDHRLIDDLYLNKEPKEIIPYFYEIPVPPDIVPGIYQVKVGLWIPSQKRKVKLKSTNFPHHRDGVLIAKITIAD